MGSIYLPYQKFPRWNIDPNGVAYNCARMGLPGPGKKGFVLAMPFWEGAGDKVYDYNGYQNNGTLTNSPVWKNGGIYFLDTSSQYINCGNRRLIANNRLSVVLGCSLPAKSDASSNKNFCCYSGTGTDLEWAIQLGNWANDESKFGLVIYDGGWKAAYSASELSLNENLDIATTFDGSHALNYINGVLDNTVSFFNTIQNYANTVLTIGATAAGGLDFFEGTIHYLYIFDVALTPSQVQTLHNNPYGMFEPIRSPATWKVPPVGGVAPTSIFYGPLVGPLGGPI